MFDWTRSGLDALRSSNAQPLVQSAYLEPVEGTGGWLRVEADSRRGGGGIGRMPAHRTWITVRTTSTERYVSIALLTVPIPSETGRVLRRWSDRVGWEVGIRVKDLGRVSGPVSYCLLLSSIPSGAGAGCSGGGGTSAARCPRAAIFPHITTMIASHSLLGILALRARPILRCRDRHNHVGGSGPWARTSETRDKLDCLKVVDQL